MSTASASRRAGGTSPAQACARGRHVIDAPTRMFHWLFASGFVGAYLSADSERWRALHVTLGYALVGLLAFRVLYGLFGPRHARLGPVFRRLAGARVWLSSIADAGRHGTFNGMNWRQGENLLMALAVVALPMLAVPLALSGHGTYNDWGAFFGGDWLAELHELFGEVILAVAMAHVGLIAGLSARRRKNLALPMVTGHGDGIGPNLVKRNRAWLAFLLLLAVLAYAGWEWQRSPGGLFPMRSRASSATDSASDRHHGLRPAVSEAKALRPRAGVQPR